MYDGLTEVSFVHEGSQGNGPPLGKGGLHHSAAPIVRISSFMTLQVGSQ